MGISKAIRGGARPNTGGRRPGAGRKSKADELELAALLEDSFTAEDRKLVVQNLSQIAKGGDAKSAVSAASLLFAYTYGKPTERHEISNPDGSPLLQPVADAMLKVYGTSGSSKSK